MASDFISHVTEGAIDEDAAVVFAFAADAASTPMWSPVIVKAAASGYYLPEIATSNTAYDPLVIGVTVGPVVDTDNQYCNTAAGEMVNVCVFGPCKCKVSTTTTDGDALVIASTGKAKPATLTLPTTYDAATVKTQLQHLGGCFAKALDAGTTDGDVIPVWVYGGIGTLA